MGDSFNNKLQGSYKIGSNRYSKLDLPKSKFQLGGGQGKKKTNRESEWRK